MIPMPNNNEPKDNEEKTFVPSPAEAEQHLDFSGDSEEELEAPDPVNLPEHHLTKEEMDQRESGQASSSHIPPPDDAPRSL